MEYLSPTILALIVTLGTVVALHLSWRWRRQRRRRWQQWRELGAPPEAPPEARWLGRDPMSITLSIEDQAVTARLQFAPLRAVRPGRRLTVVQAATRGTADLHLHAIPPQQRCTCPWSQGLPRGTIQPIHHQKLVIRSNNPDLMPAWLPPPLRRELQRCAPYCLVLHRDQVTACRVGEERDMARLQRIALVVARMAQRSAALLQDVRHLAANLGGVVNVPGDHWDPEAGILTVVQRHGVSLLLDTTTVSPPGQPTRLYTRIRTRAQSKMGAQFVLQGQRVEVQPFDLHQLTLVTDEDPTFSAAFTVFADDPRTCQRQLNASLRRRLLHLKPALLADDHHEVLLWLPGLVLNITSVEEALELVAHVARPRTIPLVH